MTAEFRKINHDDAVVLMGYAIRSSAWAMKRLPWRQSSRGGWRADGGHPPEESLGVSDVFKAAGLDRYFAVATTPESRVERVAAAGVVLSITCRSRA